MYNNETYSPPIHLFYLKFEAPSHGSVLYVVILSTSVVVAILSPLAVVTNGLILAAIWRSPSLRTPSYVLLAGLALIDLGTGLISQPIYVTDWLMYALQPRMTTLDKKLTFAISVMTFGSTSFFSSIKLFLMTAMSIERWLHMSRRSLINVRRACFIVANLFFFAIPFTAFRVFQKMGLAAPGTDVVGSIGMIFFLIATTLAYFQVFRIIRHHQKQIRANEMSENFAQPAIDLKKYKKSVFSILYILLIFYTGYVPITISTRISTVLINELVAVLLNVSSMFMFLSASLNPLLYLWRMRDIGTEVKLLVKRVFRKGN